MKKYKIIIIGSGPSGLMCANILHKENVLLLEKNDKLGGKIKVSGGGRCNVTNKKDINQLISNTPQNGKFLFSTLNNFSSKEIIDFFESKNIKLKEEDNNRIFPFDNNSSTIINGLIKNLNNIDKITNYTVTNIKKENDSYIINNEFICDILVLATGGFTYQHLGTTGDGYNFLRELNHTIIDPLPCETPLISNDLIIQSKIFQGITLKDATLTLFINDKKKITITKDLLFTHFGISGPAALNMSYYVVKALNKGDTCRIEIDLGKTPPKKCITYLKENDLDNISLNILDYKGFKTAFVTLGGQSLKEINPKTYESKLDNNLYVIGELLDINAFTGGYNITYCLSQGHTCGTSIKKNLQD